MLKFEHSNTEIEMAGNLFTNSKVVKPATSEPRKTKAREVTIPGLDKVSAIKALMKALEGALEVEEQSVKGLVKSEFVEVGCKMKDRPANFKGIDGLGEASCQLKVRPSTSALSEEEVVLFTNHNLPIGNVSIVEECFRINPKYLDDQKLLGRVSTALEKLKDFPEDFIEKQEGMDRKIVGEGALEMLFKKPEETVRMMLESVGVISLRTKFNDPNMERAMDIVRPLLKEQGVVVEETPAAAATGRTARRKAA